MAITQNILIYQGSDFSRNITLTDQNGQPLNVSGFQANAAIKSDPYSNTANVYLFQTNLTTGNIQLLMYANVTATIIPGNYSYDIVMTNGTETFRIAEGIAQVDVGVSAFVPLAMN